MGIPVLILGESGSGKSASLRNFEPADVNIINVAGKPLPFRKKLPVGNTADYGKIMAAIKRSEKKAFVIDDSQYLISVHRLVADAFLENAEKLPEVNHKDKNTMNNCVSNLEWCTREYNINYNRPIPLYDIATFYAEAYRKDEIDRDAIDEWTEWQKKIVAIMDDITNK